MEKFESLAPDAATIKDLNDIHIKKNVDPFDFRTDKTLYGLTVMESETCRLFMPNKVRDVETDVTAFCTDFLEQLKSVGCLSFVIKSFKQIVRLLSSRLPPKSL